MDVTGLIVFASALLVAGSSPGPAVAALVARVLARGPSGAIAFAAGLAIGDVVWLGAAVSGMAVLAQTFGAVFAAVKYLGAAYLLYLAWRIWTSPAAPVAEPGSPIPEQPWRLFGAGLAITLGNPKVMVFYLALVPTLIDLSGLTAAGFAELAAVTLAVLALVFGVYFGLATRARRLFRSARAVRRMNRATGAVMAGAAVAIATR